MIFGPEEEEAVTESPQSPPESVGGEGGVGPVAVAGEQDGVFPQTLPVQGFVIEDKISYLLKALLKLFHFM